MEAGTLYQFAANMFASIKSSSALDLLAYTTLSLCVLFALRSIYRLYFHPLRKYPGPKLNAITRLPKFTFTLQGTVVQYANDLHKQYGEVVRIAPNELSFVHPTAWTDIYGYGAKEGPGSKPPKLWRFYPSLSIASTPDPHEHGRIRRIFSPAFSDRALTRQAPLFNKYVDKMVILLQERCSNDRPVEMVSLYNFTTFDVMGDLTFGEPLHMLDSGEYAPWVNLIFSSIKKNNALSILRVYFPRLWAYLAKLLVYLNPEYVKHAKNSADRVVKRIEKGVDSEGYDIWDMVLNQELKGKHGLTREEMNTSATFFMTAGTETTATLMSGLTVLLLKNPEAHQKLVDEIRGAFTSSMDMTMEAIQALPYVNACIKEGLRMYPPVPSGLPHLTPAEGSTICGRFIPPNTMVMTYHMAMYRSPRLFKDPDEFHPERWLGDQKYANDELRAFQPFHVGSRDCLGRNMALHETRLILAKTLYNFDLVELCPESRDWLDQKTYMLWEKPPLMVKVKPVTAA